MNVSSIDMLAVWCGPMWRLRDPLAKLLMSFFPLWTKHWSRLIMGRPTPSKANVNWKVGAPCMIRGVSDSSV